MRKLQIEKIEEWYDQLVAGEQILLSGTIYTARDAVHKRFFEAIRRGDSLPIPLIGTALYYAGPTPAKDDLPIGSCGPTTSSRMDPYVPALTSMGLRCTIGKGDRSQEVYKALEEHGGIYLCAIGGAGALYARSITSCEVVAYEELGCESIKKLTVKDFPLFVGIDSKGNSIFQKK